MYGKVENKLIFMNKKSSKIT